jgi:uncharacterized membrane protein/tetratricopeptide (TPR) repeat protein
MSRRLALIIGNSLYRDKTLSKLISPDADVGALKDVLLDPELGGFDDVNLVFNSATHIVRREIFDFFANKSSTDLLMFYFSGHGVLDENGRLYLAVKDTDTQRLRGTAIPARYITEEMDNSRSKRQVLVLDCCHSGAFERGTKGTTGTSVGTASTFEGLGYGRVVLTASDATQYAWEGNQIIGEAENSLFTHFMVEGIQTGGADIDRDGKITVDEMFDYIFARIREKTSKQTPGKWSFKEQGELIIAHSPYVAPIVEEISLNEDQQLQKLYTEGLSAYIVEDWDNAFLKFNEILQLNPNYLDVKQKIQDVTRQKNIKDLYDQAQLDTQSGRYSAARYKFQQILETDKGYKDAEKLLEKLDKLIEIEESEQEKKKEQQKKFTEKGQPDEVVVNHKIAEGKRIESDGNLFGWLRSSIRDTNWGFQKREAIASLIGLGLKGLISYLIFGNQLFIFSVLGTPITVFFGVIFGPIVGFIVGFGGSILFDLMNVISGPISLTWVSSIIFGLTSGLLGLLLGLISSSVDFRSIKNVVRYGAIFIASFALVDIISLSIQFLFQGYFSSRGIYTLIDAFREAGFGFYAFNYLQNLAGGLILVPITGVVYNAIIRRRKKQAAS